ncbi:MAG: F0F1 ATP synthase subunit B, partial [Candidatus Accumulibacter phosphatis]|nr:F0F1 ATP synthase subunit B [Candidatus Accumulibacter phosphatis]
TAPRKSDRLLALAIRPDPALIAGVRIAVGECLLHANLLDELAFFRRRDEQS